MGEFTLSVTGTVTYGCGASAANKTDGSAESCYFQNIFCGANGTLANAFALGADTTGSAIDIAETVFVACEGRSSTTNAAFLLGNGTDGNILNTMLFGCHAAHSAYGMKAQGTGFRWFGGSTGENTVTDFYGTTAPTMSSWLTGCGRRTPPPCGLSPQPPAATRPSASATSSGNRAATSSQPGSSSATPAAAPSSSANIQVRDTGSVTPVIVLSAGSGYLSVDADTLATSTPLDEVFSWPPTQNVTATVSGYTQLSSTGGDPGVATTPGPVRLVGSSQSNLYNASGRDTAYPVETQVLSSGGAVTISACRRRH
jgi:hypothetical protein